MKENIHVRANFYQGSENDPLTLFVTFAISTTCHLIFFAGLIFAPSYIPNRKFSPSIINVSLVTLSPQKAASVSSKQIAIKPKKAPVSKVSPKAVSLTPKKKIKKSLKKETFKSSKVVENAITRIEKKVEESRPTPVTEAIERLKNQVGKDTTRQGSEIPAEPGVGSQQVPKLLVYQQEIAYHIRKNWVFSEQLAGGRTDLEVRLLIKILENGNIEEIWFEKRSGNSYLDESAYKAIKKSNPLPPLPKGIQIYNVLLGFTPSGLK